MKLELISYETAVLAKDKGFDLPTVFRYDSKEHLELWCSDLRDYPDSFHVNIYCVGYSASTQSLLQMWLRTKHGLFAYVDWANTELVICDYKNHEGLIVFKEDTCERGQESEKEMIETVIYEALKQIK